MHSLWLPPTPADPDITFLRPFPRPSPLMYLQGVVPHRHLIPGTIPQVTLPLFPLQMQNKAISACRPPFFVLLSALILFNNGRIWPLRVFPQMTGNACLACSRPDSVQTFVGHGPPPDALLYFGHDMHPCRGARESPSPPMALCFRRHVGPLRAVF